MACGEHVTRSEARDRDDVVAIAIFADHDEGAVKLIGDAHGEQVGVIIEATTLRGPDFVNVDAVAVLNQSAVSKGDHDTSPIE